MMRNREFPFGLFPLLLFFRRAARGGVCAGPTPKKMAPSSSRLLGEVWKNLDEIFGSPFQPYKIGLYGIGGVPNVPQ